MKTVHIVGLSLGGNKGGPALLASLVTLLRAHSTSPLKIVLISTNIANDQRWQGRYQVDLVPRPRPLQLWRLLTQYRGSDLVIDMHGVKFSGALKWVNNAYSASPLIFPHLFGAPTVAFTQTYGPFENTSTRLAAQIALRSANLLYAREPGSMDYLRSIGLGDKAQLYPDVALTLPSTPLNDIPCAPEIKTFLTEPFIGVTVSRKVISQEKRRQLEPRYEALMLDFIQWLLDENHRVLLIPHVYTPYAPADNDYELTEHLYNQLKNCGQVQMVKEDLPPEDLKTIIAQSRVFVGSRYHSLVAALSSGVPALSVGWNHKYDGLLGLFDLGRYSTWADRVSLTDLQTLFQDLVLHRDSYSASLTSKLPDLKEQVNRSVADIAHLLD